MNELLAQAFELMVLGMGFVFVFLTILVFATGFMSKVVMKYAPAPAPIVKAPSHTVPVAPVTAQVDAQLLSVISAAVKEYRSRHKK